jgi:stage II sporulation protein D
VRVKLVQLNFPLEMNGQGVSIRGLKQSGIKNVAIPRDEKFQVDLKVIKGENVWFVRKDQVLTRLSEKYLQVNSTDTKIFVGGYEIPTPFIVGTEGEIVSAIPLETYLEGVIAGEMPTSWPMEALKSQVIAARSYTLYQMNVRKNQLYHLEASILDQVYVSVGNDAQKMRVRQAVSETEGMILSNGKGVLKAYYHADCGGQTEDPAYVWGGKPPKKNLQSVVDESCAYAPQNKWSVEISLEEVRQKLESLRPGMGDILGARIISRTPTGRAMLVAFDDDSRKPIIISGNDLRRILGYTKIKSTLFNIDEKEDALVFSGRGSGHGSGLCQDGARYLAEKGSTARDILKHYYPSAQLTAVHVADR